VLLKIVDVFTCRVLSLAVLAFRGDPAKDAGLLVLRHENAVLRRHEEAAQAGGSSLGTASLAWRLGPSLGRK
jgi:hypothetical protein